MNIPYSSEYDDIYYSRENGWEESYHVFFQGNVLMDRWINHEDPIYTIGETGLGTGLNFLLTWHKWQEFRNTHPNHPLQYLYFVSTEKFPLARDEIRLYISEFPQAKVYMEKFLKNYSLPCKGFYRFHYPEDRITLQVLVGDALESLRDFDGSIDSWYLDGFNPKKNPDLWNDTLFEVITSLSKHGSSLATFTSASFVRRGLESLGWIINKIPGYGRKREMSVGKLDLSKDLGISKDENPVNQFMSSSRNQSLKTFSTVHIIGAGIAGASVAYALSLRGIKSIVYDGKGIAKNASGNPVGIFYPYLTKYPIPFSRFSLQAFLYAHTFLESEGFEVILHRGLEFLLSDPKKIERYTTAIRSFELNQDIVEYNPSKEALFFPSGKALSPIFFTRKLFELADSTIIQEDYASLDQLEPESNSYEDCIRVHCQSYDVNDLHSFRSGAFPILKKVRGQLAYINRDVLESPPTLPICDDSYLTPGMDDLYIAGSTYDEFNPDRGWDPSDDEKILEDIQKIASFRKDLNVSSWRINRIQEIQSSLDNGSSQWEGKSFRVSHRAQTKDRVPLVGKIPEGYIISGLGSRGLVSAMLAGEVIASAILGEPCPIPKSVKNALSPSRFLRSQPN